VFGPDAQLAPTNFDLAIVADFDSAEDYKVNNCQLALSCYPLPFLNKIGWGLFPCLLLGLQ